jgi:hypothetical protein
MGAGVLKLDPNGVVALGCELCLVVELRHPTTHRGDARIRGRVSGRRQRHETGSGGSTGRERGVDRSSSSDGQHDPTVSLLLDAYQVS